MTASRKGASGAREARSAAADAPRSVDALVAALDHPMEREIHLLREAILGADPRIAEEVKWNAPSFRVPAGVFATLHLRARDAVQVVLHLGAKPRPGAAVREAVADPDGLLQWRGADRAIVPFRDAGEIESRRDALAAVVRAWIVHV